MNDLQVKETAAFNYESVDQETADYLQGLIGNMKRHIEKARYEIACELAKAHDRLAKKGYGCFYEWCEQALGFDSNAVKKELRFYNLIGSNLPKQTLIESLPKSLQDGIARPSAPAELTQKVLDGEITTHKQWQEEMKAMKQRAEQAEQRAEQAEQSCNAITEQFNAQAEELQDLKNNPQVVIKDSEQTKNQLWNLQGENKQLRDKINSLESRIHDSSFKDSQIKALQRNNQELERKLEEYTAHSRGQTLHEYAEEEAQREERFKHLLKTHDEEAKAAKELKEFFYKTRELPDSPIEMRESLRCYLSCETDKRRGIDDLLQAVKITEERMEVLREAIESKNGKPKLEVVKK
jgi:DNA repair exonuclease SbcCD ATPase subunit